MIKSSRLQEIFQLITTERSLRMATKDDVQQERKQSFLEDCFRLHVRGASVQSESIASIGTVLISLFFMIASANLISKAMTNGSVMLPTIYTLVFFSFRYSFHPSRFCIQTSSGVHRFFRNQPVYFCPGHHCAFVGLGFRFWSFDPRKHHLDNPFFY